MIDMNNILCVQQLNPVTQFDVCAEFNAHECDVYKYIFRL